MALKWVKFKTVLSGLDCWGCTLETVDYFITLEKGKFKSVMQDDSLEPICKKVHNNLKQAKAWCERKERKRLAKTCHRCTS